MRERDGAARVLHLAPHALPKVRVHNHQPVAACQHVDKQMAGHVPDERWQKCGAWGIRHG
eukprot:363781-Chlamydomonas_euryale.AAC.10